VATRYDKRDFVYRGTIDVAAIRIWLRDPRRNTLTGHALVPAANIQLEVVPTTLSARLRRGQGSRDRAALPQCRDAPVLDTVLDQVVAWGTALGLLAVTLPGRR
jgi:hypothetical protein